MASGVRWVPDSGASACFRCSAPFGFLHRRHHCRRCGNVFCSACAPRSPQPRTCRNCSDTTAAPVAVDEESATGGAAADRGEGAALVIQHVWKSHALRRLNSPGTPCGTAMPPLAQASTVGDSRKRCPKACLAASACLRVAAAALAMLALWS